MMTYILCATRIPTMSERQARRGDDLVERCHGWNYFTSFGAPIRPDYLQDEDGTHTEIEILVADKNSNLGRLRVSRLRVCRVRSALVCRGAGTMSEITFIQDALFLKCAGLPLNTLVEHRTFSSGYSHRWFKMLGASQRFVLALIKYDEGTPSSSAQTLARSRPPARALEEYRGS